MHKFITQIAPGDRNVNVGLCIFRDLNAALQLIAIEWLLVQRACAPTTLGVNGMRQRLVLEHIW
jgi:hypothetical protein